MSGTEAVADLCVIGGSEAGLAACLGAVALGLTCVLVDDGDPSGLGNPDLALAALANAAADPSRHADAWEAVANALARAAPERRHARFGAMNVRLIRGCGRFGDGGALMVDGLAIRARRIFIATGGRQPAWRLTEGLLPGTRLSISDLGRLERSPRDILVVGGGPQAVSAAQSLARLGSRVTLAVGAVLPGFDPELTAPLVSQLRRDGVTFRTGHLQVARAVDGGVEAQLSDGPPLTAARLLLAEEGRPALDGLDLARVGLMQNRESLVLDAGLRTSRRHIHAIGRAAGAASTAEGVAQAGHALRAAFLRIPGRFRGELVPVATATEPQIGAVGRSSDAGEGRSWRWPLAQTGGAALLGLEGGEVKVSTDRRGRVIAAGLVGTDVRELLPFWSLAVTQGLTLAQLGQVAVPTPSRSESIRTIALQDLGQRLRSPWLRRALTAARWFG